MKNEIKPPDCYSIDYPVEVLVEMLIEKQEKIKQLEIRVRSTTNALIHIADSPFFDVDSIQRFAKKFLSDIIDENNEPKF